MSATQGEAEGRASLGSGVQRKQPGGGQGVSILAGEESKGVGSDESCKECVCVGGCEVGAGLLNLTVHRHCLFKFSGGGGEPRDPVFPIISQVTPVLWSTRPITNAQGSFVHSRCPDRALTVTSEPHG